MLDFISILNLTRDVKTMSGLIAFNILIGLDQFSASMQNAQNHPAGDIISSSVE